MPQTKKPGRKPARPSEPESKNGVMGEVLSLAEAATYLRVSEADVLRLIDEQALPARRIGKEWRFLKSAIQHWLSGDTTVDSAKAAQLAVAGSWKEDPLVEEELREIYKRRRASVAEEES